MHRVSYLSTNFLRKVQHEHLEVNVYLNVGIKLSGKIHWYDHECILLEREGKPGLIFLHAVASIMPLGEFHMSSFVPDIINGIEGCSTQAA